MDTEMTLLETDDTMTKAVEFMIHEFASVRTGKASPTLVEGIDVHVASYGSHMKLKQLAVITTPEPRLIVVSPFDPGTRQDIEKGLRESKLGINPVSDGKVIRLPIPELNQERRKELVKVIKTMAEEAKVRVRAVRRDTLEKGKKAEKDSAITEDDLHRLEEEVQKLTDRHVKEIDVHVTKKEAEVMAV
ncbi:MAG: ribosome recycling factor [Verrucomicrobiales bacterium]|nr:ribosome recycling factor [Verrucomicrobiales bacterium]